MQTQKGDRNTKVSDVKNLSGGERSFATYCFLLALGHVVSQWANACMYVCGTLADGVLDCTIQSQFNFIYTYIHNIHNMLLGFQIESSFRIMDEYDVFMDEVTRKETIKMMEEYVKAPEQQGAGLYIHACIQKCKPSPFAGRQFILLTPNNLSHVSVSNQVRVKKMPDPERHASAHGPQQQTLNFS